MRNWFIPFLIFFVAVFISCGNLNQNDDKRTVFNYNEKNGVSSLDPAAASNFENISIVNQLFNGLLQLDDSLNILPCIAHSYSLSSDHKTYTLFLRQDVFFHDNVCFKNSSGRKVIAKDFEYSFNRLLDSKVSSAASLLSVVDKTIATSKNGFEAKNDSVFIIYLNKPFSAFLNILTMKYFSVVPFEAINYYQNSFRSHPVGTGPFVFKMWQEGTKLILHKNPKYFEKDANGSALPYLDAMTVSFIKDRETAFLELLNGRFDMLSGADAFNVNEVLDKNGNLRDLYSRNFYLQKGTFLKTDYIGILVDNDLPIVKNSPLRIQKIRQAINYGFDRSKMIKFLRNGIGKPAHAGFIPPGLKSFDSSVVVGYSYRPEKTAALLREAGFANGKNLPEITLHITEDYKEQSEFIQSQLAKNNIKVQISVEKASVLRQAVNRSEYLLFKKSWVADYGDEENFMSLFYSKNFCPAGVNFFRYKNENFDKLFEQALMEDSLVKRQDLFKQMDAIVTEDAPVITLYYDEIVRLVSHGVKGLSTNPLNLLDLKKVKKLN